MNIGGQSPHREALAQFKTELVTLKQFKQKLNIVTYCRRGCFIVDLVYLMNWQLIFYGTWLVVSA